MAGFQTEYEFILPKGFVDGEGNLHRKGVMRLATAMDEIVPLRDPRVRGNQAYLTILLLSRVVTRLGTLADSEVSTGVIEHLFASDLGYLQAMYNRVNSSNMDDTICPTCGRPMESDNEQEGAHSMGVGG
jgi:hypothetical protein